jgi:hypothetical protein
MAGGAAIHDAANQFHGLGCLSDVIDLNTQARADIHPGASMK